MKLFVLMITASFISGLVLLSKDDDISENGEELLDRVCVKENAELHDNPERTVEGKPITAEYWTFARYIETADNGMELVRLEDGGEYWVERDDFYPVYEVIGEGEVEFYEVYFTEEQLRKEKPRGKPGGMRVAEMIKPGELVAGIPIAQAPIRTIQVLRSDGSYGYINIEKLLLVGEPGWGMDEPFGLELYDPEED